MFTAYNVSPIAIALFVIYAASFGLYKAKRIRAATHRKIWNVLLLVTFLMTGALGLTMAIRRDYVLMFSFPINMIFWHVEAGVVMTLTSVFHLSWHLAYYRDLLRSGGERGGARREDESKEAVGDPTPPSA